MSTKPPYSQSLELQNARDRVKELEQKIVKLETIVGQPFWEYMYYQYPITRGDIKLHEWHWSIRELIAAIKQ